MLPVHVIRLGRSVNLVKNNIGGWMLEDVCWMSNDVSDDG